MSPRRVHLVLATAALLAACAQQGPAAPEPGAPKAGALTQPGAEPATPAAEAAIQSPADISRVLTRAGQDGPAGIPIAPPALIAAAAQVHTDPGDLPHLRIVHDGVEYDLPLRHTDVRADVSGFAARVSVVQQYENPFAFPIEAVYVFPLPENSAVDAMRMVIGERVIEAEIKTRDTARRTYEDAKAQGHTAALLEQERPNVFTQSVANIAPGTAIEVEIGYVQTLAYDAGSYEFVFPMVVGPRFMPGEPLADATGTGTKADTDQVPDASRISPPIVGRGMRTGADISIALTLDAGLPVIDYEAPTHEVDLVEQDGRLTVTLAKDGEIPNRDFVFRYAVDGPELQAAVMAHKTGRAGSFAMMLQPPRLDIEELVGRREMIFVVDSSGSMSGEPLAMAKEAVRSALLRLRPVDTFNVITFAGNTARAFRTAVPADQTRITEALRFLDEAQAGGGTMMSRGVDEALAPTVQEGRHRYVFFVTDGYIGNEDAIMGQAAAMVAAIERGGQRARVMTLGTGSSVNRHLIEGLAKAGKGTAVVVTTREEPTRAVDSFFRKVDSPVLTDISIDWKGLDVTDLEPAVVPDLFASRPVIVHGRYAAGGQATVTVHGKIDGREVSFDVPVELPAEAPANEALESLWARARVASLEEELWYGRDADTVQAITDLGLDFHIVTAWTSFVAVDRSTVVEGDARTIVQPADAPEGVDTEMAGAEMPAQVGSLSGLMGGNAMPAAAPAGGMGFRGTGSGGGGGYGGNGLGRIQGMGHVDTGGGRGGAMMAKKRAMIVLEEQAIEGELDGLAAEAAPAPEPAKPADEDKPTSTLSKDEAKAQAVHVATVSPKSPLADGAMDPPTAAALKRLMASKDSELWKAFEARRAAKPDLAGRVEFELVIGADGVVTAVKVLGDSVGDAELTATLTRLLRRHTFPTRSGAKPLTTRVSLVFATS
ncbi:MAG: VWA domain-containing protein [Deltaproteobacteria bacterium]|nr:VWA domain-containing protein [Deltaproteobacteria bacterium]